MFLSEESHENLEKKVQELLQRDQDLKDKTKSFFEEAGINPDDLSAYLNNRENFTEEEWEVMEEKRKELDEKLERELSNIPNPAKTKGVYKQRSRRSDWVRI